jgi:hypothetical protein
LPALGQNAQWLAEHQSPTDATLAAEPTMEPPMNTPQGITAMQEMQLKMGIGFLLKQAQAGNPVVTYVDMVLDNVPFDTLVTLMQQADPVALLAQVEPQVTQYKAWFDEFLKDLKEAMAEPEPLDNQPEG